MKIFISPVMLHACPTFVCHYSVSYQGRRDGKRLYPGFISIRINSIVVVVVIRIVLVLVLVIVGVVVVVVVVSVVYCIFILSVLI